MKIKKAIIIFCTIIFGMAVPILGMRIPLTKNLVSGLMPKEADQKLTDKIDANNDLEVRVEEANTKIAELQRVVDDQKTELSNYQQQSENISKSDVEKTTAEIVQKTIADNESNEAKKACEEKIKKYKKGLESLEADRKKCSSRYEGDKSEDALIKTCQENEDAVIKSMEKNLAKTEKECAGL